jgi:uncharacterized protein
MRRKKLEEKSAALHELAATVFGDKKFDQVKTNIGIVTRKWVIERPMIFKGTVGGFVMVGRTTVAISWV